MSITPIGNEGTWSIGQQTVQRHHPSFTNTASLLGLSSTGSDQPVAVRHDTGRPGQAEGRLEQ